MYLLIRATACVLSEIRRPSLPPFKLANFTDGFSRLLRVAPGQGILVSVDGSTGAVVLVALRVLPRVGVSGSVEGTSGHGTCDDQVGGWAFGSPVATVVRCGDESPEAP